MSSHVSDYKHIIAVDVGKHLLEVTTSQALRSRSLTNKKGFIRRFLTAELRRLARVEAGPVLLICEATGGYEKVLLTCAYELGLSCYRAEGRRVRLFAQAHGLRAKTDPLDSSILLKFAQQMQCTPLYQPPSPAQKELADLVKRRDELLHLKMAEENRLEHASKDIRTSIKAVLAVLIRQMKALDAKMAQLLKTNEELARKNTLLQTVIGVGDKTSRVLLAHMPELGTLNKGQAAALAGLAPYNRDSGTTIQKRHIMAGRSLVRRCLFMAATVAIAKNPIMAQKFQELRAKGKPYKVALVAIMRKLIITLNAILKENTPWKYAAKH